MSVQESDVIYLNLKYRKPLIPKDLRFLFLRFMGIACRFTEIDLLKKETYNIGLANKFYIFKKSINQNALLGTILMKAFKEEKIEWIMLRSKILYLKI